MRSSGHGAPNKLVFAVPAWMNAIAIHEAERILRDDAQND